MTSQSRKSIRQARSIATDALSKCISSTVSLFLVVDVAVPASLVVETPVKIAAGLIVLMASLSLRPLDETPGFDVLEPDDFVSVDVVDKLVLLPAASQPSINVLVDVVRIGM